VLVGQHPSGVDDRAHSVEDPLRTARAPQPGAPVGEVGEVKARVVEGQAAGHLPVDTGLQLTDGVAVRKALQGLEHHHRTDELDGDRGPFSPRREQIGEVGIFEQVAPVISKEGVDGALLN